MIVLRLIFTAGIIVLAVFGVTYVWKTYFEAPWTRDAYVRADVVQISSLVSGKIVQLNIHNNEVVKAGAVLMQIDPTDYRTAVERAKANVAQAQAQFNLQNQQAERYTQLNRQESSAVAEVQVVNAQLQAEAAEAALEAAQASLRSAQVNLDRTTVTAPVDGYVTNLLVDQGDYATAGEANMALVDSHSYRVEAFFMETKLPAISIGASARVKLMAGGEILSGKVSGIARAIYNAQNNSSALLQSPEPSFQWIRLAQRIPVEITLDEAPRRLPLVSGLTATVMLTGVQSDGPRWMRAVGSWFDGLFGWSSQSDQINADQNPA